MYYIYLMHIYIYNIYIMYIYTYLHIYLECTYTSVSCPVNYLHMLGGSIILLFAPTSGHLNLMFILECFFPSNRVLTLSCPVLSLLFFSFTVLLRTHRMSLLTYIVNSLIWDPKGQGSCLFYSLCYLLYLAQCHTYKRSSLNIYKMNSWMNDLEVMWPTLYHTHKFPLYHSQ